MVMDACSLPIPDSSYDAVFSMNCLLHVPKSEFALAINEISRVLKPAGLFYLGIYGGNDIEEIYQQDTYEPPRFFSFWSDAALQDFLALVFKMLRFESIELDETDLHFQSLILQNS